MSKRGQRKDGRRTRRSEPRSGLRFKGKALRNGAIATVGVAIVAVIVALGVAQSGNEGSSGGSIKGTTSNVPGMEVPDFSVRTTSWSGGQQFILSQNLNKPTALYFMAAWCFTCIPETQAWERIHTELGDQLNILILDVDTSEDEGDLLRFKERAGGGDHLWAMDTDNNIARAYNVRTLDTTIIIDQTGKEVYRDSVPTFYRKLKSVIASLLEGRQVIEERDATKLPGQVYPDQGRQHLALGQTFSGYNSNPATSGPHDPNPAKWGIYDQPIPKEMLVHNLEHGGELILYSCTERTELIQQLKLLAQRYLDAGHKVILAPYSAMEKCIALVAWTYLDTFDELDATRIVEFFEARLGEKAPEANVR